MLKMPEYIELNTDVLIIGGGAAATEAAIHAVDAGVDVILIDKKKYGRSGDSGQHAAGMNSASYLGIEGDNPEINLGDAVACGKWMVNQKLAEALCEGINQDKIFLKLENYGCLENRTQDGNLALSYSINRKRATAGYRLFNHAYEALRKGVKVFEHTMMTSLLIDSGEVVGATAIDIHTGQFYVFKAKSTVLATGGVGLAVNGTLQNERTGDGHAAAYKVGAEFWNLEFRAMPFGCIYPSCLSRVPYLVMDVRSARDKDGVEFLRDIPQTEELSYSATYRDVKEVEKRIAAGKGSPHGGVYAQTAPTSVIPAIGLLARQGFDINKFEYNWTTVYDFGGLVINERAETTVEGLYACGEIASNMGADYLPIRMFSHCITSGRWAGENAAHRAKKIRKQSSVKDIVDKEYQRVLEVLQRSHKKPLRVHEARQMIQETASRGCGPWRSHDKATASLSKLSEIGKEILPRVYVRDKSIVCNMEWKEALEAFNMLIVAEMVTRAVLTRTESRGTHIREDYPYMDNDNWLKSVYVKQVNGKMTVTTRPVCVTKVVPPTGRVLWE